MPKLMMIKPQELRAHEDVDEERIRRIVTMMTRRRVFHPPLLVDRQTMVVLDGHHRLEASKELGCRTIPCFGVDYLNDEEVRLESWREDITLTKQQVIDMGLSDEVFPFKTTRHLYAIPSSIHPTPLDELIDTE
jgi:ParB-like chromosome segregation protein Spo0J